MHARLAQAPHFDEMSHQLSSTSVARVNTGYDKATLTWWKLFLFSEQIVLWQLHKDHGVKLVLERASPDKTLMITCTGSAAKISEAPAVNWEHCLFCRR
jgi:hypothetical protein